MASDGSKKPVVDESLLEFKRLDAAQSRFREVCVTIRWVVGCVAAASSVGLICWAVVRIVDKPAWLALVLCLLSPGGLVAAVFWYWLRRSKAATQRLVDAVRQGDQVSVKEGAGEKLP